MAVLEDREREGRPVDAGAGTVEIVVLHGFLAAGAFEPRPPVVVAAPESVCHHQKQKSSGNRAPLHRS